MIDETIEVRRALDLLLAQPQVNRKRIGFVGHDYGAMYGALVAGVEKRVKAYVLIAVIEASAIGHSSIGPSQPPKVKSFIGNL